MKKRETPATRPGSGDEVHRRLHQDAQTGGVANWKPGARTTPPSKTSLPTLSGHLSTNNQSDEKTPLTFNSFHERGEMVK